MWSKLFRIKDFVFNMGVRYVVFRIWHTFQIKSGVFIKKFPINPDFKQFISLEEWKVNTPIFLINSREEIVLQKQPNAILEARFQEIYTNKITFFSNHKFQLQKENQWHNNPETNFKYNNNEHWSTIEDLSKEAGDIKYVWEKARFTYLQDVFRYDYHFEKDHSEFVFQEIEHFIDHNPINQGPQYKCSQEISLRILNWTYALYFYKNSVVLDNGRFEKIMNAIYWQLHHVYHNIHFSRIAVRNNHAITETLVLYLSGLLFPFMPDTSKWSIKGKKWFENEIAYQIYDDGTFLQYSMNYHRVVVQLLTWAIRINDLNGGHSVEKGGENRSFISRFNKIVYQRALSSLEFLESSMDPQSGKLPNYGSNDGALFFKWTDDEFRIYKSQLTDLRASLTGKCYWGSESLSWYGLTNITFEPYDQMEVSLYPNGGYSIINEKEMNIKTFIHCGAYKDRPAQADNNHLDIWINGVNYFWDNGSYKYNTSIDNSNFFAGTQGHNTITIDNQSQMLKGARFIWYYWVKKASISMKTKNDVYQIVGKFKGFKHLGGIEHIRKVQKKRNQLKWVVEDNVSDSKDDMKQHWHINPDVKDSIHFYAIDEFGNRLDPIEQKSKHSSLYGSYKDTQQICFQTKGQKIKTTISIKP